MFEPVVGLSVNNRANITDPSVVYGHRVIQTRDVKWLCLDQIYQKLHRPNLYDIGGTYMHDVADYWFSYRTEQFSNIFLLHLFISNHGLSSFNVAVSGGNQIKVDKKASTAYLMRHLKEFQFKQVPELSYSYLTTYTFSQLDVESLKDLNLYIATSFPFPESDDVSVQVVNNIKLCHDFGALLTDPIGSDFTIESSDGVKFPIHRLILTAHSEVFKAMLKEETAESQNSYVKLVDVAADDLKYMLEFIYTGTVKDIDRINSASLLVLADRYDLKGLWELSQYALYEQMSVDNVIDILTVGDLYDSEFLKLESFKFIKENKDEITKNGSLNEINSADLLRQLCVYIAA